LKYQKHSKPHAGAVMNHKTPPKASMNILSGKLPKKKTKVKKIV
jgi:hypothetical protein